MANVDQWGHCQHCKFFGRDQLAEPVTASDEERLCHEPTLERFELMVTGACGCNHFQAGKVAPQTLEPSAHPTVH